MIGKIPREWNVESCRPKLLIRIRYGVKLFDRLQMNCYYLLYVSLPIDYPSFIAQCIKHYKGRHEIAISVLRPPMYKIKERLFMQFGDTNQSL